MTGPSRVQLAELAADDPVRGLFLALEVERDPRVAAAIVQRILSEIRREKETDRHGSSA